MGLAIIALPCRVYSMDLTVPNLAVPHLTRNLARSSTSSVRTNTIAIPTILVLNRGPGRTMHTPRGDAIGA